MTKTEHHAPNPNDTAQRVEVIDLLRGVAILMVLLLHFQLSYKLDAAYNQWLTFIFNGNYGVTIFFVVSGYLITSNILQRYQSTSSIKLRQFYILRAARIMPPLIVALVCITLLHFGHYKSFTNNVYSEGLDPPSITLTILSVLTFWHNYMMTTYGYFNYAVNIYWSLSVEGVFYILFPIISLVLRKERLLIIVLMLLIVSSPIYRSLHSNDEILFMYANLACFDAIAFGVLVALIQPSIAVKSRNLIMLLGIVILFMTYGYLGIRGYEAIGFSLVAIGTSMVIVASKNMRVKNNFLTNLVCHCGRLSYELYLFHIIILGIMRGLILPQQLTTITYLLLFALYICISCYIAKIISMFYSEPVNRHIRNKYAR